MAKTPRALAPGTPSSSRRQRPQAGRRAPGSPFPPPAHHLPSCTGPAFGLPRLERRPSPSVASPSSPSRLCQMSPAQGGLAQPPSLGCSCLPDFRPASSPTTSPQHWDTCSLEGSGLGEVLPAPKEHPQVPCPPGSLWPPVRSHRWPGLSPCAGGTRPVCRSPTGASLWLC